MYTYVTDPKFGNPDPRFGNPDPRFGNLTLQTFTNMPGNYFKVAEVPTLVICSPYTH